MVSLASLSPFRLPSKLSKNGAHLFTKSETTYVKSDDDVVYEETRKIDLGDVRSFFARYLKPNDIVPVQGCEGIKLDGCFIGACNTAEEDLIFAALVLGQGLRKGKRPSKEDVRKSFRDHYQRFTGCEN